MIAGSPISSASPAFVIVPTPEPALKTTPDPGIPCLTVTMISAPCVTSGSSPASFIILTVEKSTPFSVWCKTNSGFSPLGKIMLTGDEKSPVINAVKAAFVAAVAQAPVVQPRLRGPEGLSIIMHSKLCCKNLVYPVILSEEKKI